ncbi:MAG: glycosyltransferase family 2 protein, partial [Campylobacteraceae bacterium]|nr:glycosyltransferase family 2 protein [Campylobacteraceae bacterium]
MKKSDIVVVVPTYNNPLTIEKVAKDVLDNGYSLIIIDDGSDIKVADIVTFSHTNLSII